MAFGGVFVHSRKMTDEERADPNTFMFKLCHRFKPEYWYWEYVIFIRRILTALFAVGLVNWRLTKLAFMFMMFSHLMISTLLCIA